MTSLRHLMITLPSALALAALTLSSSALAQADPLDDLPEAPAGTAPEAPDRPDDDYEGDLMDDPLDDLPETDAPETDAPEADAPEADTPDDPPADPLDDLPEGDPLDDLPEADDEFADVPDQAPAPGGGLLSIEFTSEIVEMRLKGPDGKYYTDGRLEAGRYVLGVRYKDGEDWDRFTFDLLEGKEMRIDCNVTTQQCKVKSRDWKP